MHVVLSMDRQVRKPEVGGQWWVSMFKYRNTGKLDLLCCGPYKVLEVSNKGDNVKVDNRASFDGLRIFNRDTIKP